MITSPPTNVVTGAQFAVAVTPSDANDLPFLTRALWIGGGGAVQVTLLGMPDGSSVVYAGIAAGTRIALQCKRVWAAATTASLILAEE